MKSFSWLHLTDLHFGLAPQATLWPNVREAFFEDLKRVHEKNGPWDAVFFTGDLVQSGSKDEFTALDDHVIFPLKELLERIGSKDAPLISVPGNHDLSRPNTRKPTAALRQLIRPGGYAEIRDELWVEDESEYRDLLASAFENYQTWAEPHWSKLIINAAGPLAGDFALTLTTGNAVDELRIGVAGINTAFLQLNASDYRNRLAIDLRQLHKPCRSDIPGWAKGHDFCLLLSHHGPNWLDKQSLEQYNELYQPGRFAVHLFGHMHEAATRSSSISGGKIRRLWQGRSMFGLEKFGEPPEFERRHGYSIGRITVDGNAATIRHYPRRAFNQGGWRFEPDHESCVLVEPENNSTPEQFEVGRESGSSLGVSPKSKGTLRPVITVSEEKSENPIDWPELQDFRAAVSDAHGYIRFVEIPLHKDLVPVEIGGLYVEPRISELLISPDLPEPLWPPTMDAATALLSSTRLIILGDPGAGKSTLISSIASQLCQWNNLSGAPWCKDFGGYVPIPIILRELKLKADVNWEGLVSAFLDHSIGKLIQTRSSFEKILRTGKAIVLLDGLDEIGNLTIRKSLRDAVHGGMSRFPKCRWILTSRVIGYDSVAFHLLAEPAQKGNVPPKHTTEEQDAIADVLYLAPFNDLQIREFASNWYSQHESQRDVVSSNAKDFVDAVSENDGTGRLARIPYLLTLMALIHQKNARLPNGRTDLYERIATAYLEQIDLRRRLDELPYSLQQKRRWLAEIAFKMQLKRTDRARGVNASQVLASELSVKRWLKSAMGESSAKPSGKDISSVLSYFAARSGLLLPRGDKMFSFMHLSLQEYFAACYIDQKLTTSRFAKQNCNPEPSNEQLKSWANEDPWRETFVLLFEMMSQRSMTDTETFLEYIYTGRLEGDSCQRELAAAGLLAEVAIDSFVNLSADIRRKCIHNCWTWVFRQVQPHPDRRPFFFHPNLVVRSLLRESGGDLALSWKAGLVTRQELAGVQSLDLSNCLRLRDISVLAALPRLKAVHLRNCRGVYDFSPINQLKHLEVLNLDGCDLSARTIDWKRLSDLRALVLGSDVDLADFEGLTHLRELHLHYRPRAPVSLDALSEMAGLEILCCQLEKGEFTLRDSLVRDPSIIKSGGVRDVIKELANEERKGTNRRRRVISTGTLDNQKLPKSGRDDS